MTMHNFLPLGQTMTVGELRAALDGRMDHERVNVFIKIGWEAVALEDVVRVTHHQPFDPDDVLAHKEFNAMYRSVGLHVRGMELTRLLEPRRPISSFTF